MACCHQHNHQSSTCCCSRRCNTPPCHPPPPPSSIDPLLLQSIVSQILQHPQTAHLHYTAPNPAFTAASTTGPFDLHSCSSSYPQHKVQKHPKHKQFHPRQQPFEDQFQTQHSVLSSLFQRIDVLESSLHRFSSASSSATGLTLRHLAARTIQTHFRAYLVRRSRALRELKELASIKSALNVLRSSLSIQKRLDFFSLSREAMDLIRRLEIIQGGESGDQMVRDSKSSVRREIAQFLELIDDICVRNQVSSKTVKHIRMVRNDDKCRVSYSGRGSSGACHGGKGSKHSNFNSDEKRLINNLRERVERIQEMSRVLKDKDKHTGDGESIHDSDYGNSAIGSKTYTDQCRRGVIKDRLKSRTAKHVGFLEDGNVTWVYDIDGDGKEPTRRILRDIEKNEELVDEQQEGEGEVDSDTEENAAESAEGSVDEDEAPTGSEEGSSLGSEGEETPRKCLATENSKKVNPSSHPHQSGKLILSAPAPVKMEGRADLMKKQNGVK